jgi:hypothetical protein
MPVVVNEYAGYVYGISSFESGSLMNGGEPRAAFALDAGATNGPNRTTGMR